MSGMTKRSRCRAHDWTVCSTSTTDLKCRNCSKTTTEKKVYDARRAAAIRNQKAIIEFTDDGLMVMHHDGYVEFAKDAVDAFRKVQAAAKRGNKSVTITTIEWRNTPEGFEAPGAAISTR